MIPSPTFQSRKEELDLPSLLLELGIAPDELPRGWRVVALKELGRIVGGGTPKTTDAENFGDEDSIPWITPADLSSYRLKTIGSGRRFLTEKGLKGSSATLLPKGAILFSSRAPIGYVAIASQPLTTNQGFRSIVSNELTTPDFLYHYLRFAKPLAERLGSGTTFTEISGTALGQLPVVLPPLPDQFRIVGEVEALLERVSSARDRLAAAPKLLRRFRQSVLLAAFSGELTADWRCSQISLDLELDELEMPRQAWFNRRNAESGRRRKYQPPVPFDSDADLPDIPDLWRWKSADEVSAQITDGEHIQPRYQREGYPMLTAKHVRDGFVDATGSGLIAEADFRKCLERCAPMLNDLLIVSVGATTGRTAVVDRAEPFAIVRSVLLVKPLISPRFFMRWCQTSSCFQWMVNASGASAQPHFYINDCKRMPVPVPPAKEQNEIVRRVDTLFALADSIESRLTAATGQVERTTQAILAKAFRGEL